MDKTVECGSCDKRFVVSDKVTVKSKEKFYPGEKNEAHLERFSGARSSESALTARSISGVGFQQASYQPGVSADVVSPVRPRRTMASIVGVGMMVIVILIFVLAGGEEGAMRDMETKNRFVLVGFAAFLGCALVFYGLTKKKLYASVVCLIFGGALLALPMIFPGNPMMASERSFEPIKNPEGSGLSKFEDNEEDYIDELGYIPVAEALEKYPRDGVVCVYLRGAKRLVRDKIADYLYVETGSVRRGTVYDRADEMDSGELGMLLMVEQEVSIDEISEMCRKFGKVNKLDRDLRVVDISVDSGVAKELLSKKSVNAKDLNFQEQQLLALQGIDPKEKMNAVKSLGYSEPIAHRADITAALLEILPDAPLELQLEVIKTLQVWSQLGDGAEKVVLATVKELHKKNQVSKAAMEFLIARKTAGCEVILYELWIADPVTWSDQVLSLGAGAQMLLLPNLEKMDTFHIVSAADILAKVGEFDCLEYLEAALKVVSDEAAKKSLKAAIDEIKNRS